MRKAKSKLLLATSNLGKAQELAVLLESVPFIITTPQEEGITLDVEETGATFGENATLKARAFAVASGLLTIADDSGLEVDALCGAPGVLSARYAGPEASDEDKVRYLLGKLELVEWGRRGARFRSVISVAWPAGTIELFYGTCEGIITLEPLGVGGFGYDPIFYIPFLSKVMAELSVEEKNGISHRGIATRKAVEYLKGVVGDGQEENS